MVTVERVLPWRRKRRSIGAQVEPLVAHFADEGRDERVEVVTRAYRMAARAHAEQRRKSGEPYIVHPLAVARIVAGYRMDEVAIAAALLHDAVEDTRIQLEDIKRASKPIARNGSRPTSVPRRADTGRRSGASALWISEVGLPLLEERHDLFDLVRRADQLSDLVPLHGESLGHRCLGRGIEEPVGGADGVR